MLTDYQLKLQKFSRVANFLATMNLLDDLIESSGGGYGFFTFTREEREKFKANRDDIKEYLIEELEDLLADMKEINRNGGDEID